jgi:hypothetical protein
VFAADFAILVAVAIVETCLAHAALHCAHSREHPPAGTEWQLNYARKIMFYARHHPDDEGEATDQLRDCEIRRNSQGVSAIAHGWDAFFSRVALAAAFP